MSAPSPAIRHWFTLVAALLLLRAPLTLGTVWPTPWVEPRPESSVEVAALLLGLAAYAELASRRGLSPPGRRTTLALAALMFFLTIGRYADVTAPALYGRPVNLYWDARHLPNVGAMLAEVAKPWRRAAFRAGLGACAAVIGGALYWALARVERSLRNTNARRALGVLAAALVAAFVLGRALDWPVSYWFSSPVLATYRDQVAF